MARRGIGYLTLALVGGWAPFTKAFMMRRKATAETNAFVGVKTTAYGKESNQGYDITLDGQI